MVENCFYCDKDASLTCLHCHSVASCSRTHLDLFHRPKNICYPFKIMRSTDKGLHMVACRDIKPMEVVLEEFPCSMGPYMKTLPQCLECFRPLIRGDYKCSKCNFPLCNRKCEEGKLHAKLECLVLQKCGFKANIEDFESLSEEYSGITTLRTLILKESAPVIWKSLQHLTDHRDKRESEEERDENNNSLENLEKHLLNKKHQSYAIHFVRKVCNFEKAFSEADVDRVIGIMMINNANLSLAEGRGTGLYTTFARINHSCICNTKSIKFSNQRLEVRAAVLIKSGEEITNQYVKPNNATMIRRPLLKNKWYFDCKCRRCADPTELGSYLNACLCPKCRGVVLPIKPLQYDSKWRCLDCNKIYHMDFIQSIWNEMEEYLEGDVEDEDLVVKYERFLHEFSDKVHANHQSLVDAQNHLVLLYGNVKPYLLESLPRPLLERKIQVCHAVLESLGKVDPGYSSWRGKLLYEMTRTKVFLAKRDFSQNKITDDQLKLILREEKFLSLYLAYYQSIFFATNNEKQ